MNLSVTYVIAPIEVKEVKLGPNYNSGNKDEQIAAKHPVRVWLHYLQLDASNVCMDITLSLHGTMPAESGESFNSLYRS